MLWGDRWGREAVTGVGKGVSMSGARPLFIVNPAAGNGSGASVMMRARDGFPGPAEIVETSGQGDAERLAEQGASEGYAPVVAVGGDGTINEVVNGLMRARHCPPLGIVAAGGGNDAARTLRLPKDPAAAARLAWHEAATAIDLGTCNDRYFLNVAGVGLDTKVAAAVNASRGRLGRSKAGYIGHALNELRRYENPELTIHLDDESITTRALLVAIANLRSFAGGMIIAPDADPSDGMLDVVIGADLSRREALVLFPAIFVGQHGRHRR